MPRVRLCHRPGPFASCPTPLPARPSFNLSSIMQKSLLRFILFLTLCGASLSASAASVFYDANGSLGCGGVGNWGSGAAQGNFWGTACDTGLTTWNNANVDSAIFSGTLAIVTLTNNITVNLCTFNISGFNLAGGSTLTFSGA